MDEDSDYMCVVVRPYNPNYNQNNINDNNNPAEVPVEPYQKEVASYKEEVAPSYQNDDYAYYSTVIKATDQIEQSTKEVHAYLYQTEEENKREKNNDNEKYDMYNYAYMSTIVRAGETREENSISDVYTFNDDAPYEQTIVKASDSGIAQEPLKGTANGEKSLRRLHPTTSDGYLRPIQPQGGLDTIDHREVSAIGNHYQSYIRAASPTVPPLPPRSISPFPPGSDSPHLQRSVPQLPPRYVSPPPPLSRLPPPLSNRHPPPQSPFSTPSPYCTLGNPSSRNNSISSQGSDCYAREDKPKLSDKNQKGYNRKQDMMERAKEGNIEKFVQKKWTKRYIRLQPTYRCLIYYIDQNCRKSDRIRGVYPLLKAEINDGKCNEGCYCFNIRLLTGQMLDFRVETRAIKEDWSDRLYAVASKDPEPVVGQITGELLELGKFSSKKRHAVLDPNSKILTIYSISKHHKDFPKQQYEIPKCSVIPEKSHGDFYEFTLKTESEKKVRFRTQTMQDWNKWFEALYFISKS